MFRTWEEYTDVEQAAVIYSDCHKDVYGFRPRDTSNWTLEQFEAAQAQLDVDAKHEFEAQVAREKEAVVEFESQIAKMISMGANDRETALRWMIDAFDEYDRPYLETDPTYFNYVHHLPTNYDWQAGEYKEGLALNIA